MDSKLQIGYMPLVDAAPIIMAEALGIFKSFGLDVSLKKLQSWDQLQGKFVTGSIDAAHTLASMVLSLNCGNQKNLCPTSYALCLNKGGSAITISNQLWNQQVAYPSQLTHSLLSRLKKKALTLGLFIRARITSII